eukprot:381506_1
MSLDHMRSTHWLRDSSSQEYIDTILLALEYSPGGELFGILYSIHLCRYTRLSSAWDDLKCDIFPVGVVLFLLMVGYPPFEQATKTDKWFKTLLKGNMDMQVMESDQK